MNNLVVLLLYIGYFVVQADLTPQQREELFKVQVECMEETGATDDMIMSAFAGNFSDDPIFKEHLVCIGRKSGVIDDEGKYHKDLMKQGLMTFINDEDTIDQMLEKCYIEQDSIQELAYRMTKCLYNEHFGL
ncbi:hypothetical protein GWI33_004196 [Rhynchophorus ferrugineus]|uniref:Odorant binding protein OBPu1 n=1 Tax=Rhynchophorus ferrugineus TaxID=354439 RepID=A0A2R3ZV84_RHYFE|nr:odorant binding protein OBPu1 [Rhynchophorus ferrugineus]KAF7286791.1 hypothetical protein GWI33_004196 [Rhynchophorus ferrugineus]